MARLAAVVALAALLGIAVIALRRVTPRPPLVAVIGAGVSLGGGTSNLIEMAALGHPMDFMGLALGGHGTVFSAGDNCIYVGGLTFAFVSLSALRKSAPSQCCGPGILRRYTCIGWRSHQVAC